VAIAFSAQYGPSAISTTTPQTNSPTVVAGDILAVIAWIETGALNFGTPSGGGYTYTSQVSRVDSNTILAGQMWGSLINSSQSYTLSETRSAGAAKWAFTAYRFTGVGSFGATGNGSSSAVAAATFSLTTTAANSAIVMLMTDANGANTTLTYSTATAGAYTEITHQNDSGLGTFYGGYYLNAGAAGAKTIGATNTSLAWLGIAVELIPAPTTPAAPSLIVNKALRRSTRY
jgi:hypothetical protein